MIRKKSLFFASIVFSAIVGGCSNDAEPVVGNNGYQLVYHKIQPNIVRTTVNYGETADENDLALSCANLLVLVRDSSEMDGYSSSTTPVDQVGKMLKDYILSVTTRTYDGLNPIPVEYTTVGCRSVRIMMTDADGVQSDITSKARFHYHTPSQESDVNDLYVSLSANNAGKIPLGTTIETYLSMSAMLFATAYFIFPDISRQDFANAQHIWVEIELDDGRKLISKPVS